MSGGSRSLMDFVDTPVLVGDPDGRAVYVNPSFEREFRTSRESVTGVSLASLFGGGAREAVLSAVARVCRGDPPLRMRVREAGKGWVVLASPVEAEGGRVGVVMLLTEEPAGDDRMLAFRRDILEPLDELSQLLGEFAEQTGGRRSERYRMMVADGVRALERIRKFASGVETELLGAKD
jgi:PAS fold